MKTLRLVFVLVLEAFIASILLGETILLQRPEDIVRSSPLIAEVVVKEIRFSPVSNLSYGEARIKLLVVRTIIGSCPKEIEIRRDAVTANLRFLDTEWLPSYSIGERFITCLWPKKDGYSTMGLMNGKFGVENGTILGTSVNSDEFARQIALVHAGTLQELTPELPRHSVREVKQQLNKSGIPSKVMTSGSHLNGEFLTWDFTWDPDYVPVLMHYNSANAPSGTPSSSTIATLASMAYGIWSDAYSSLTLQNASAFTTGEALEADDFSVIFWLDFSDTGILARCYPYPNDPIAGNFYGPGSNTGVDVRFNPVIGTSAWYFGTSAPSRTSSQIDFVEILAHELGHGLGLQHVSNTNSIMYGYYLDKTGSVRSTSDGDKAGKVYQHTTPSFSLSGSIPHSLVFSALSNRTISLAGNVTVPSGLTLQMESNSPTMNLNGYNVTSNDGSIINNSATINGLHAYLRQSDQSIRGLYGGTIQSVCSNATDGDIVDIQSGTFTENLSVADIWGFTLQGQGSDQTHLVGGITANSVTYLTIQNLSTTRCTYLNECDGATLLSVAMDGVPQYDDEGLQVTDCLDFGISGNSSITNFYPGAMFTNTDVYSWGTQFHPNAYSAVMGYQYAYGLLYGSLFCGRGPRVYDLMATTGAYLESDDGFYVGGTPRYYGNVGIWGDIGTCPLLKGLATENDGPMLPTSLGRDSCLSALTGLVHEYRGLKEKFDELKRTTGTTDQAQYRADHLSLIDKCKAFIEQNPSSPMAGTALSVATHSYRRLRDYQAMKTFLDGIATDPDFTVSFGPSQTHVALLAQRQMIDAYKGLKDYEKALAVADEVLEAAKADTALTCEVLYSKGLVYAHQLGKATAASACFSGLVQNYPGDPLVGAARNELSLLGANFGSHEQTANKEATPESFGCRSYPNPFNPSTTVTYHLPVDAFVSLKIFDVLGKEVTDLAHGHQERGSHSVLWDAAARGVASGFYFVRFTVTDGLGATKHSEVSKLLLMK